MKTLTCETELDYFLERLLRKESVGRKRKRLLLCSLLKVDRRNKKRKSFELWQSVANKVPNLG